METLRGNKRGASWRCWGSPSDWFLGTFWVELSRRLHRKAWGRRSGSRRVAQQGFDMGEMWRVEPHFRSRREGDTPHLNNGGVQSVGMKLGQKILTPQDGQTCNSGHFSSKSLSKCKKKIAYAKKNCCKALKEEFDFWGVLCTPGSVRIPLQPRGLDPPTSTTRVFI